MATSKPTIADLGIQLSYALIRLQEAEDKIVRLEKQAKKADRLRKLIPWLLARNAKNRSKIRSWARDLVDRVRKIEAIPQTSAKPANSATPAKPKRDVGAYPTISFEEFAELGLKAYPSNAQPGVDYAVWCYIDKQEHRILAKETAYADDFA